MLDEPVFRCPPVSQLPRLRAQERRRRVVFVASRTDFPLELIGPMNVLVCANWVLEQTGRSDLGYDIEVVASQKGHVTQWSGLTISADTPFDRLRGSVDTLLVSPMEFEDLLQGQEKFLAWVKRMSGRVRRIGSICFGTYILAEAGVLEGRRATTHWDLLDDFRERYPDVAVDVDPIYVKDGHVYTSAGATAGIDLVLALVEEDFGSETALRVAQLLVLFLKRPGSQSQFSVHLSARFPEDDAVAKLQTYISEHLDEDLRVDVLAERVGMSTRGFSRVFNREVGMAPGRYVEQCRLEVARQWLEDTQAPLSEIASRCGYGTADGMRLAFERNLGLSPRAYRQRFSTTKAS